MTLMQNLNTARSFSGLPAVAFATTPAAGAGINRTQMNDLRNAVK